MQRKVGLLLVGVLAAPLAAQDFSSWKAAERAAFSGFVSEQDQAFLGYLDQQWKDFKAFDGIVRDPAPKPPRMPEVPLDEPPQPLPPVVLTPPAPEPEPAPQPEPPSLPSPAGLPIIKVSFFGEQLELPKIAELHAIRVNAARSDEISAFWKAAAAAPTQPLVDAIDGARRQHGLNDWALMQLLDRYAASVYPASANQQTLLQWFLLTRLGYRCKVGLANNSVHLYLPVRQMVYETPFLNIGQQRYFINLLARDRKVDSLTTYEGDFPGADRVLDLAADSTMMPAPRWKTRDLAFRFKGQPYQLSLNYDANKIDFLATYPQTDFPFYFSSIPATRTAEELLAQLSVVTRDMDERDAVNFLLRFAQTAFDYKTDADAFGFENYLLIEETLHYPYSDCEDRSILFAWLVRELLGLDTVGLLYPGHVAVAVRFKQPLGDGQVRWNGKVFNVADPTYINADAGMVMPQFVGVTPEIIAAAPIMRR